MASAIEWLKRDIRVCPSDCTSLAPVKPDECMFWRKRKWCRKYDQMLSSTHVIIRVFPNMVAVKGCPKGLRVK